MIKKTKKVHFFFLEGSRNWPAFRFYYLPELTRESRDSNQLFAAESVAPLRPTVQVSDGEAARLLQLSHRKTRFAHAEKHSCCCSFCAVLN